MSDSKVKVEVAGGTFALCFWLFLITWALGDIAEALKKIAEHMK